MKKFEKVMGIALGAMMLLGCTACGGGGTTGGGGEDGDATTITIWAGGSSEYQWKKGSAEEEVYKYIEDLYYEEMGVRLKFNVQFLGQTMKTGMTTQVTSGKIDAVISHVGGGDGLDDWFLGQTTTLYRDLQTDFAMYENLEKHLEWSDGKNLTIDARDRVKMLDGTIIGIPSVITPYKFGILVRKDWMEACGYTDDPADTSKTLVNDYVDFENMALAMKQKYGLEYAVSGAIYEVEKTGLLGAYGLDAGYYTMTTLDDGNGNKITDYGGLINPAYADVLKVESRWIQNGVLATSPDTIKVDVCEEKFISEATGIFLQNGTIEHLIEVARACKAQNSEAEFAVLCGLTKDETSTAKGNMRNSVGTFMASITANSPDHVELLDFLNWVYSDADIYNACRYGEEGKHWIDNGDGTYSYPEGYSYYEKPYSGILTLVENQVISNLQYSFTNEEKGWIEKVRKSENYIVNDTVDYLLFETEKSKRDLHFKERKAMSTFTQNVWDKKKLFNEDSTDVMAEFLDIINGYRANARTYSLEMNQLYNDLKNN